MLYTFRLIKPMRCTETIRRPSVYSTKNVFGDGVEAILPLRRDAPLRSLPWQQCVEIASTSCGL